MYGNAGFTVIKVMPLTESPEDPTEEDDENEILEILKMPWAIAGIAFIGILLYYIVMVCICIW